MHRILIALAFISLLILPGNALAQEAAPGVIEGQVVNGTEGGGSVAGVEVTLITYIDDAVDATRTSEADSEGNFRFEDITPEYQHLVFASYMDVHYYNQVIFETGETTAYVEVGVCDTTDSDEMISAAMSHTIINIEEDSLELTEVFWLMNDGDRTYAGTEGALIFTLPEGATNLETSQEMMADFEFLDDNRLAYLVPFPPGERQIFFTYRLPRPDSGELTLPLKMDYPAESFALMVGGEDIGSIEVTAPSLIPVDPVTADSGEQFICFQGESLPRGTVIDVSLSGLSVGNSPSLTVLWVIITLAIIVVAAYLYVKKKGRGTNG